MTESPIDTLIQTICNNNSITKLDLFSMSKRKSVVRVRHAIAKILRHKYNMSYNEITDKLGYYDVSCAYYAVNQKKRAK